MKRNPKRPQKRQIRSLSPQQEERRRLFSANTTKLVLFLKRELITKKWVPNVFNPEGGPVQQLRYADPVVEAFDHYVRASFFDSKLRRADFDPAIEFEAFLETYRNRFVTPLLTPNPSPVPLGLISDARHQRALLFLKEIHKTGPKLTKTAALREARAILKPLASLEFARPKQIKRHSNGIDPAVLEQFLLLWNRRLAARIDCSIEDLPRSISQEGVRLTMEEWAEIVRTKFPVATLSFVRTVRTKVYELRRSRLRRPSKRKRDLKSKGRRVKRPGR